MSSLELRIPPPLVALLAGLGMWLLARQLPGWSLAFPGNTVLAIVFALAGIGSAISAVRLFSRRETTPSPLKPQDASTLVIDGPYRFTRNPMYVGLGLVLLGWAIYLANGAALVVLPLYAAYITRFQILPEERALTQKFGEPYRQYLQQVRRWL